MKVLFVANDPSIFKEESEARGRMRAYAATIGELHIISQGKSGVLRDGALTLHGIAAPKLFRPLVLAVGARKIIRTAGIEVVSAQDPFEHGWAAMCAVKGTSARLHIQVHTDFCSPWFVRDRIDRAPKVGVPFLNYLRRNLADIVLPAAQGIRVVSTRIRDSLVKKYGNRIPVPSVIPIGARTDLPAESPLPPHSFSFTLITVGRLEPEKRIEDILYALARLGYTYSAVGLVIVGDGSERKKLMRLTKTLGLTSRVMFTGWRTDALGLLQNAQAYIQASAYEGYGRSLIEAALVPLPIITTDVGIVGDVLIGYEDVLAAPPGDPAALAAHMRTLVEDHGARKVYAENAERKVKAYLASIGDTAEAIKDDLARTCAIR